jgi:hypothetical protein
MGYGNDSVQNGPFGYRRRPNDAVNRAIWWYRLAVPGPLQSLIFSGPFARYCNKDRF